MKRTKILTVLAALLLILGLAACGMSKDGKENEGSKETGIASLLAADPAVLEAVVLLAAPPQPVSTPAQRARAVRATAALWMVRFLIFVRSFPVFEHDFC